MIRPASSSADRITHSRTAGDGAVESPATAQTPVDGCSRSTDQRSLDECLSRLVAGQQRLTAMSIRQRVELLDQCVAGISAVARDWVNEACEAKGLPADSPSRAEEVLSGPVAVLRQIQLYRSSLLDIERTGKPRLPRRLQRNPDGRIGISVTPARGMFDPVTFIGFHATTWMLPEVTTDNLAGHVAVDFARTQNSGPSVVLGAGNVSGIPAADALTKLAAESRTVLLKMNPVNEYLGTIFERAFRPLIEHDLLRVVYGGPEIAASAIHDERTGDVHITGSHHTFNEIVWGQPGEERERRVAENDPVLKKPISSELGSVTPWIVVPGRYSRSQLKAQAANVVASLVNNAGFNCVATRIIVTCRQWPQREEFLQLVESLLARIPQRVAYYPGAFSRYEQFSGQTPDRARAMLGQPHADGSQSASRTAADGSTVFVAGTQGNQRTLPWTLLRNVAPLAGFPLICSEAFACVAAEIPIDASSPAEFLTQVTDFCNERLWGTLACSLSVPRDARRNATTGQALNECIDRLRYGVVSLNQWAALAFALMSPPWGGHPSTTAHDIQSGHGWVHNSLMLDGIEKTVLDAPLIVLPKPVWDPSHGSPESVAWCLFSLMRRRSLLNLNRLALRAFAGALSPPRIQ
ncbi:MAG: aldehyde dehydrogenase family protein [Planctomycetota bacterium]|jgi:acyl-CoA reductase-like NAD-dependent aldehyde dehydrogenase